MKEALYLRRILSDVRDHIVIDDILASSAAEHIFHIGVIQDSLQFFIPVTGIDQDRNRSDLHQRQKGKYPVRTVDTPDSHMGSPGDSHILQSACHKIGSLIQLRKAAAPAKHFHGGMISDHGCLFPQILPDCFFRQFHVLSNLYTSYCRI